MRQIKKKKTEGIETSKCLLLGTLVTLTRKPYFRYTTCNIDIGYIFSTRILT